MRRLSFVIALFLLPALVTSAPAVAVAAEIDANDVLRAADKRAASFDDQAYNAEMAIYKDGTKQRVLKFSIVMKGLEKQLIEFDAPGDVAGMKILLQDADTLYVYSPEFKKVRRIAAHMQSQGFLGSTFTYEDMTRVQLAPYFDATIKGRKGTETTLALTPKPGRESSYSRLEVVIDSTKGGITTIRYFDGSGTAVREQIRENWRQVDKVPTPTKITMKDLKTGSKTTISLSNLRVNQGVDDGMFSRRTLMRG